MDDHSSDHAVTDTATAANPDLLERKRLRRHARRHRQHAVPIWRCSRWGLPCRRCYQPRGGLLPHRFTLTCHRPEANPGSNRRFIFCGAFRRVAPPGRYPAPFLSGVRTFLPSALRHPSSHPAFRARSGLRAVGSKGQWEKRRCPSQSVKSAAVSGPLRQGARRRRTVCNKVSKSQSAV